MLRLNALFSVLVLALSACIESPPPSSQPIKNADMANDSDTEADMGEDVVITPDMPDIDELECSVDSDCEEGQVCKVDDDPELNECVDCIEDADCNDSRLTCSGNQCVGCQDSADICTGMTNRCDTSSEGPGTCVECLGDENDTLCGPDEACDVLQQQCVPVPCFPGDEDAGIDDTCSGNTDNKHCKVDEDDSLNNECVECLGNPNCTTAANARCSTVNTCKTCRAETDCTHIQDAKQCVMGACVGCTTATEAADCNGVCNPTTNTCTTSTIGATLALNTCVSDTQCQANHACVPLTYMSAPRGNYCMPITAVPCNKPYGGGVVSRVSLGVQNVNVCMIRESLTTPEAVGDYGDDCTEATVATDCPALGARCAPENPTAPILKYICTYSCSTNNDCLQGSDCVGPLNARYCGAE